LLKNKAIIRISRKQILAIIEHYELAARRLLREKWGSGGIQT